jgi:hypothetical protein
MKMRSKLIAVTIAASNRLSGMDMGLKAADKFGSLHSDINKAQKGFALIIHTCPLVIEDWHGRCVI